MIAADESLGSIDFNSSMEVPDENIDSKDDLKDLVEKMENREEGEDINKIVENSSRGTHVVILIK